MNSWTPPVAFYFKIEFSKSSGVFDMAFQEISGLSAEMEVEEIEEGGESRFKHQLPKRRKHGNLVCKRALVPLKDSPLGRWARDTIDGDFSNPIETANAFISLLDAKGNKVAGWFLSNLYPIKWQVSAFDSKKNDLAIETIEFAFNTIERKL